MKKILFDLKKEYYLNSLLPLYRAMADDHRYELWIRSGSDSHRLLWLIPVSNRKRIEKSLTDRGFRVTSETGGFDGVVCGDALKNPERYGGANLFHLDHGVGIKTLRIRNIVRQKSMRYHVFLEGRYWHDYVKSLGWGDRAEFHVTGLPKLDPLFTSGFYDASALKGKLNLDPAKKTILFAPSYKPSCIGEIGESIISLVPRYNLIVKLHPYSWGGKYAPHSQHRIYQKLAEKHPGFCLVPRNDFDVYPYLYISDTIISDTSSVINEFLALGRHGIIYELPYRELNHSDGMPVLSIDPAEWLKGAFPHIDTPEKLSDAVRSALDPTEEMISRLNEYRDYFFTGLDGRASRRVKEVIDSVMGF